MALRSPLVIGADGLSQQLQAADAIPVSAFGATGVLPGVKLWIGETVTNAAGLWTVDLTTAGFASPPKVIPQALSASTNVNASATATLTARTATSATGYVNLPATVVLGGLGEARAGAGVTVMVLAIGS